MADQVSELTVRPLKAADVRTVARILGPQVRNLPTGEGADAASVGKDAIARLLAENTDDLWAWLADLAGMTAEQLDEQPLDAPLTIAQRVAEDPNIGPFARQLRALLGKVSTQPGTGSSPGTAGGTPTSTT